MAKIEGKKKNRIVSLSNDNPRPLIFFLYKNPCDSLIFFLTPSLNIS